MQKKESLSSISRRTGVTLATLRAWRESGVDLHSPKALADKIANRQPSKPTLAGNALHDAKLKKLLAEARTAELRADIAEGKAINLEDLTICLTKIGSVLKAQLSKLRADMPPMLYGLSQAEMTKRIGDAVEKTLQGIVDELEAIKTDPPRPE